MNGSYTCTGCQESFDSADLYRRCFRCGGRYCQACRFNPWYMVVLNLGLYCSDKRDKQGCDLRAFAREIREACS